jgi:hypothetical protein
LRVGFDFHNALDSWPNQITNLMRRHKYYGDYVCVISAVGHRRKGTVASQVLDLTVYVDDVYEVAFQHPSQSPELKLQQASASRLDVFYDDREDVCNLLTSHGILCFRVPRLVKMSDVQSDKEM